MTPRSGAVVFWVLITATPACKGVVESDPDAAITASNDAGHSPQTENDSSATSSTGNCNATPQVDSGSSPLPVDSSAPPPPFDSGSSPPPDTGSDSAPYDTSTGPIPGVDASGNVDAASVNTDGSGRVIPLDGGDCTSAIAIPLGDSFSGTTCGGFPAIGESFCQEPSNPVVYFTVDVPDGGSFVIDVNPRASILSFSGCGTSTLECSFDSTSFQFDPQFPQFASVRLFAVTQIDETCGPFTLTVREPLDAGDGGDAHGD